jgi:multidrug efflux pump subunit AcrB
MTPSVFPILSLVLTGGDSPSQLRDYAFYQLAPSIKNADNVPGVLKAEVSGGDVREIEVIARPDDLLAHGMSAADLADQIMQTGQLLPVGRIEGQPFAYQIIVNNQAETDRAVGDLVISTKNGQPLRVRDVADVRVLHTDRTQSIGFAEQDAVVITVSRQPAGNTVDLSNGIHKLLEKNGLTLPLGDPKKQPPRNIQARVVYDQAVLVDTAVNNVRDAILIGGLFSILILLAFLRSVRATLMSALAIPTTLAITFLFMHWSGATLNLMSLGGLAVAIGLIIDDTVVVIENIARHLSPSGEPKGSGTVASNAVSGNGEVAARNGSEAVPAPRPVTRDPVDAASGEITGAVIGSTLTTVLVFLPLAFIVGVYGQFFASLSWSLSIAVLVSMVISLTLVPVFAAKFLAGRPMPAPGPIYRAVAHVYEVVLAGALRIPWVMLGLSLAAVGAGVLLYTGIPGVFKGLETGLMPAMDEGAFVLDYWAPSGTPLAETEKMARDVEGILSKNPDIDAYVRRTGAELGLFATQTSRGDFQVVLRRAEENPWILLTKPVRPSLEELEKQLKAQGRKLDAQAREEIRARYRRRPLQKVMEEVEDEIKDNFAEHQFKVELLQIMQDELGDLSGAGKPIEIKLFGPDYRELRRLADGLGEKLEKQGKGRGVKEVNSGVREGNPDLMIEIDGVQADRLGLKPDAVARQLRAMFQGQIAAQVPESSTRITDIRVRYPDAVRFGGGRFEPDRILSQWVLLPPGAPPAGAAAALPGNLTGPARAVPLSAIARVKPVRTPEEQWRENQQPVAIVTSELNEDEAGLGSVVADVRKLMADVPLPAGYRWELGGYYVRQQEAFWSLTVVMVVAVMLVFIMLAFQFRSVVLPLLIFLTQPLSLVSGLFALWLAHVPLNISSYMGAILLVGLDMKNGILLVEYIQQLRAEGMELQPALLLAGRTRFRPILMTSLAAILGLFPLALGIGPGAQMQQPLAIMVIGGLTANMLFTRMIIPVGYLLLERGKVVSKPAAAPAVVAAPAPVKSVPQGEPT